MTDTSVVSITDDTFEDLGSTPTPTTENTLEDGNKGTV